MDAGDEIDLLQVSADLQYVNGDLHKASDIDVFGPDSDGGIGDVADAVKVNGGSEGSANFAGPSSSEFVDEISGNSAEIKTPSKKTGSEKMGHPMQNGPTTVPRNQRASLSKSLTLPSKGVPPNGLRKNKTDAKQPKLGTNVSRVTGTEFESSKSNAVPTSKQIDFASAPVSTPSLALKSTSDEMAAYDSRSEPQKDVTPQVASQKKSGQFGFSFMLDERAEKRKEFFQKLEEKTQAKEAEKTNMQAKSKENQEAEIKQLRKSLTFKAKPMPTFYKEPGPPKVELKKIPTTRAVSPKLGRHKPSPEMAKTPSSIVGQTKSCTGMSNGNEGLTGHQKKLIRKSLSKLPSQRSGITGQAANVEVATTPTAGSVEDATRAEEEINHLSNHPDPDVLVPF